MSEIDFNLFDELDKLKATLELAAKDEPYLKDIYVRDAIGSVSYISAMTKGMIGLGYEKTLLEIKEKDDKT